MPASRSTPRPQVLLVVKPFFAFIRELAEDVEEPLCRVFHRSAENLVAEDTDRTRSIVL